MAVIDDRTGARDYPLPHAANRVVDDVPRLREAIGAIDADVAAVLLALAGKAAAAHVHALADITGLVSALAGKASSTHVHALSDLTDTDVAGAANGMLLRRTGTKWAPAALTLGDISGWEATVAAMIAAEYAALVGTSPATLDTLGELAAALGNDPAFATTITTLIAGKLAKAANLSDVTDVATARANLGAEPANANLLKANVGATLAAGFVATEVDDGASGTAAYTPTPVGGNFRKRTNTGAHTINAPIVAGAYTIIIEMTNGAAAGAVTFAGFAAAPAGAQLTTTVGHKFLLQIIKTGSAAHVSVVALQ